MWYSKRVELSPGVKEVRKQPPTFFVWSDVTEDKSNVDGASDQLGKP